MPPLVAALDLAESTDRPLVELGGGGAPDRGGHSNSPVRVGGGVLVPKDDDPDAPRGAAARALEVEVEAWLNARPTSIGLSEAVLEDRCGR